PVQPGGRQSDHRAGARSRRRARRALSQRARGRGRPRRTGRSRRRAARSRPPRRCRVQAAARGRGRAHLPAGRARRCRARRAQPRRDSAAAGNVVAAGGGGEGTRRRRAVSPLGVTPLSCRRAGRAGIPARAPSEGSAKLLAFVRRSRRHANNVVRAGLELSSSCGGRVLPARTQRTVEGRTAMNSSRKVALVASVALAAAAAASGSQAQQPPPQSPNMTFFVAGAGSGKGADLGGLEGADRICQQLAQAAGAGGKTWRAYLSTQEAGGAPAVNARDRIGRGAWQNFQGEVVAQNVDGLHNDNNKLGMQNSLTERGNMVAGVGYTPNYHDVLTGSQPDGKAFPAGEDRTCRNWTSSTQGTAMLGHIDRKGLRDDAASKSWNSSHPSRGPDGGCSQNDLRSTGGFGLIYCFAAQ